MTKALRCGVIGVGYLGKFHAQKYAEIENVDLVAVADTNQQAAQSTGKTYNCKVFTNYLDMLALIDLVSVVVPTELHYTITKECLLRGIHVLLEKPITKTIDEADELIALARKKNVKLQIGHLERYNPTVIAMQEIINQPQTIQINRMATFNSRSTDISVILDLMIHDIEIVQYWLQQSVVKNVTASGIHVLSNTIDFASAVLEFTNGCLVTLTASRINTKQERMARIYQNKQHFSVDFMNNALAVFTEEAQTKSATMTNDPKITSQQELFGDTDAIKEEICDFIASINNDTTPMIEGRVGRDALAVALEISHCVQKRHNTYFANNTYD